MKRNGFTFVELLMVMFILGIIASITVPLINNLVNNKEIYRSYLRKAINDVSDGRNYIYTRTRNLTGGNCPYQNNNNTLCSQALTDSEHIRDLFTLSYTGTKCGLGAEPACGENSMGAFPGIIVGNKIITQYEFNPNPAEARVGYIYYDINGKKGPNRYCADQYKFVLYGDRFDLDDATCAECKSLAKKMN